MGPVGAYLHERTDLITAGDTLSRAAHGQLAVLTSDGEYQGVVTARGVADALADPDHGQEYVSSVLEYPTPVHPGDLAEEAMDTLDTVDGAVPVLDPGRTRLLGWLNHQGVLAAVYRSSRAAESDTTRT